MAACAGTLALVDCGMFFAVVLCGYSLSKREIDLAICDKNRRNNGAIRVFMFSGDEEDKAKEFIAVMAS